MNATMIVIIAELLAGWLGYQIGRERGQREMESKRGRRVY